jgi:hypothetical protein
MHRLLATLRDTAVSTIWALGFLASFCLPLSLWFEFPANNANHSTGDFVFYLHAFWEIR